MFYDRLIDDTDRDWLFDLVSTITKDVFKQTPATVFARLAEGGGAVGRRDMEGLLFGTYVHPTDNAAPYDEATDMEAYLAVVKDNLEEYNQINKTPMDLVLFNYLLMHLSRIARILKQDGTWQCLHAHAVGASGLHHLVVQRLH